MNYALYAFLVTLSLFVGTLLALEAGRWTGLRQIATGSGHLAGTGTLEAAILARLGLLIAFSFSGAAARFDARRLQILQETNAISTAYLRLDLLPAAAQPPLHELFRRYLDARLDFYANAQDVDAARSELAHTPTCRMRSGAKPLPAVSRATTPARRCCFCRQ